MRDVKSFIRARPEETRKTQKKIISVQQMYEYYRLFKACSCVRIRVNNPLLSSGTTQVYRLVCVYVCVCVCVPKSSYVYLHIIPLPHPLQQGRHLQCNAHTHTYILCTYVCTARWNSCMHVCMQSAELYQNIRMDGRTHVCLQQHSIRTHASMLASQVASYLLASLVRF